MTENARRTIETMLASPRPEDLRKGLDLVKEEIARVGSADARELFEVVSTLFYFDPIDRPDLVPILDEAISLVVGFGQWVIPSLVEKLGAGDLKAQLAIANALGRIGADAIVPLLAEYDAADGDEQRVFILYALGKIRSPRVLQSARLALSAADSLHTELRDTATRAMGKFAEAIPPDAMPEDVRSAFLQKLHEHLVDENAGVRAKAMRSLGKMAKHGHVTGPERARLRVICERVLGRDDQFEWDRAYIVRREAAEALNYLGPEVSSPPKTTGPDR
jgi:HEAT repeat protein